MTDEGRLDRRTFVSGALALPAAALLASCGGDEDARPVADGSGGTTTARDPARPDRLAPTPTCDDGDEPTASQTEGPFFTPDSPRRRSLVEAGMAGTRLVLAGLVLTTDCRPVRGAVLDFWQADDAGEYDNSGYRLRGNQRTDGRGRYELTTIVPGDYPGRTKHIHVKAARPDGGEVLTTQLYFPDAPGNDGDSLFDPALLVRSTGRGPPQAARFDFVLT